MNNLRVHVSKGGRAVPPIFAAPAPPQGCGGRDCSCSCSWSGIGSRGCNDVPTWHEPLPQPPPLRCGNTKIHNPIKPAMIKSGANQSQSMIDPPCCLGTSINSRVPFYPILEWRVASPGQICSALLFGSRLLIQKWRDGITLFPVSARSGSHEDVALIHERLRLLLRHHSLSLLPISRDVRDQPLLEGNLLHFPRRMANVNHETVDLKHPHHRVVFQAARQAPVRVKLVHPEHLADRRQLRRPAAWAGAEIVVDVG